MFKKFFTVFGLVGSLFASNAFADGHATLKQVQDRGTYSVELAKVYLDFQIQMMLEIGLVWTLISVEQWLLLSLMIHKQLNSHHFHLSSDLQLYHQVK